MTPRIIPAPRADCELVLHGSSASGTLVLLVAAGNTRSIEIKRLGPAMVAEPTNRWLVVDERNLLGLRAEGPRARHVEPCVEALSTEFLVVIRAAEEESVAEPLNEVEADRNEESYACKKCGSQDSRKNSRQTEGEKGNGEADYPEASDDGDGVARHV